jgi:hypothetical protein
MVVIPTSRHVSLHYGWTPVDGLGWVVTALGLIAVVWMGTRSYVARGPRRGGRIGRTDATPSKGDPQDTEGRAMETALNRIGTLSPLPWSPTTSPTTSPATGPATGPTTPGRPPGS